MKRNKKKWKLVGRAEHLEIGDKVALYGELKGTVDGRNRMVRGDVEYGVVTQTWDRKRTSTQDCHVAFVGNKPSFEVIKTPKTKPYILRYYALSLVRLLSMDERLAKLPCTDPGEGGCIGGLCKGCAARKRLRYKENRAKTTTSTR